MRISTLRIFILAFVTFVLTNAGVEACNLSAISLCGITGSAPNISICLRVCSGYGRTGTTKGADNDTRSISFGWYDTPPAGFTINSFTPPNITSARGFSNCTMPGINIGPQGPPYNSAGTVIYVDPGYYGAPPCVTQPFGCVTSTALCGNAAQQCVNYTFVVNRMPDSVRVYGVEGGGNPVAGCYPDADMMINFTTLAVEWGTVEGIVQSQAIKVKWTTTSEINTDLFLVERASESGTFEEIGSVRAAGFSTDLLKYEYMDLAPLIGVNRYRIVQIDDNGNLQNSPAVEAQFDGPSGLAWGAVGPNPASDFINLTFFNEQSESMELSMFDLEGKVVIQKDIQAVDGANAIRVALNNVEAGVYFVSLQGTSAKLTRKIVVL
jgi:hypothetical protein